MLVQGSPAVEALKQDGGLDGMGGGELGDPPSLPRSLSAEILTLLDASKQTHGEYHGEELNSQDSDGQCSSNVYIRLQGAEYCGIAALSVKVDTRHALCLAQDLRLSS